MRRPESCRNPLDAVRPAFPRGKHRRTCRLKRHNARPASSFLQRARHTHNHSSGTHAAAKRCQVIPSLFHEFPANSHVSANRVLIIKLVCIKRPRFLRQFFRAPLHPLIKLRRELAVLRRKYLQVPAKKPHRTQLLVRKSVRRNRCKPISLDCAHHRQRRPGTSSRPFHHPHPRTQLAARLRPFNHRQRHPIFVRPGRIVVLQLHQNFRHPRRHNLPQPHHRRIPNRLQNRIPHLVFPRHSPSPPSLCSSTLISPATLSHAIAGARHVYPEPRRAVPAIRPQPSNSAIAS